MQAYEWELASLLPEQAMVNQGDMATPIGTIAAAATREKIAMGQRP